MKNALMDQKINIKIKQPKHSIIILIALSILCVAAIYFCGLSLLLKSIICLVLAAIMGYQFYRHTRHIPLAFAYHDQHWMITDHNDKEYSAQLLENSFVSAYLIILNFKLDTNTKKQWLKQQKSIVLFKGMMNRAQWQKLRLLLATVKI
ncbi:MAG: protein YgfX [Pseudomonadota bacterium]